MLQGWNYFLLFHIRIITNSSLTNNFDPGRIELNNSSYYPSSFMYKNGQFVYLRCAGITTKEVPANAEYVVGIESMIPEKYRPLSDITAFVNVTAETKLKIIIKTTGRVSYVAPTKLVSGFGLNLHFIYATGRSVI